MTKGILLHVALRFKRTELELKPRLDFQTEVAIIRRMLRIVLVGLASILLAGCNLLPKGQPAALKVTTTPQSTVFVDGKHMGTTPFMNETLKAGEVTLKLVPESGQETMAPWEGLVELTSGVVTVVNQEIGKDKESSAGEILTLQPNNQSVASLSVVSQPDAAIVRLDGQDQKFTPLVIEDVSAGDHQLVVSTPGYKERTISIKTQTGYRLSVSVQLAKDAETAGMNGEEGKVATESAEATGSAKVSGTPTSPTPTGAKKTTPSPTPSVKPKTSPTPKTATGSATTPDKPYVKINDTPTGFLRVRAEASLSSAEVTRVNPGETFSLKDEKSGWYQIEYETGKTGWVAGQYAEKYE